VRDAEPDKSDAFWLAELLRVDDAGPLWGPDELAAIFEHQLSAPVDFDLSVMGGEPPTDLAAQLARQDPPIASFRDLFGHPHPPVDVLERTKQFAKQCRRRPAGPLPAEIATVLYLLSIVVAMTRGERRISKLDDEALRASLDWALEQPWLDAATRDLLLEGY
jgi:hypothetical protein